ncbi:unnamed protein product [Alopecurus aequalis]
MAAGDPHRREPGQRRPMCAVCAKPLRVCLCGRLRGPPLDTTVGVTVLQHTKEVNHPLSSIRVARLGLRNLAVTQVTDVNHRASFLLRTLDGASMASDLGGGETDAAAGNHVCSDGPGQISVRDTNGSGPCEGQGLDFAVSCGSEDMAVNTCLQLGPQNAQIAISGQSGGEGLENGKLSNGDEDLRFEKTRRDRHVEGFESPVLAVNQLESSVGGEGQNRTEAGMTNQVNDGLPRHLVENISVNSICTENIEISAAIGKGWTVENMEKCSIAYTEKELRVDIERGAKPKIRWLTKGSVAKRAVSNGFTVMKTQKKKSKLTGEVSEFEEFSITIPPHSALLFPCQRAISIDASDCQVKHLIVLDGTWAKAQRMYHENPWLQLLPHVMLESDRVSLYSEVRHEPKPGCLSTIESIVVAMKKLGEDEKGLDDVLAVFESMIVDQRRCKDENWKPKLK